MPDRIDGMDVFSVEEYFSRNGKSVEDKEITLPDAPRFPLEALPEPMAELIRSGAKSISCPEDYLAAGALGTAAGAIGSSRVARIKSSWIEPCVLYVGLVGPSGDGKSPAEREACLPVYDKQDSLFSKWKLEMKHHEQKTREYKAEESIARKEGRAADKPPDKPYLESVFVQDTTAEALVDSLYRNNHGLLRIEDELGGMVQSFDQYKSGGKGRERSLWLSIWSSHPIKVDRKSGDVSMYIPRPCISLVGNIQPKMLPAMLPYGEDLDGFAARLLFSFPETVPIRWTDDEISESVRKNYKDLVTNLYNLQHGINKETIDEDKAIPIEVSFSDEARSRFAEYYNETMAEMETPGFDDRLRYPWSKFRGYCARIALVLAMCRMVLGEGVKERIELEDVEGAILIVDYFKGMAKRVYASMYGLRPMDRLASDVVERLKSLPGQRWYGRPEAGFQMIREASNYAPAAASELCKKLQRIAADHPVLRFEHGFENDKKKERYWLLELEYPSSDPPEDPGPKGPGPRSGENSNPGNGVRRVRQNGEEASRGEVIPFPRPEESDNLSTASGSARQANGKVKSKTTAVHKKPKSKKEFTEADFLAANEELAKTYNLIYFDNDKDAIDQVVSWLKTLSDVAVDIETYGTAKSKKDARKKEALSFIKGKIRIVQLSSGEETYFLDTMFLSNEVVRSILDELKGKALYFHNSIFDVPRLKRHFGVDLMNEDIRDTIMLSRLARAGEWVDDKSQKNRMRLFRHNIQDVLIQEGVAEIPNETDHRWDEPLNEQRLLYACDDVRYLSELYRRLMKLIEERDLTEGLQLFKKVYPVYMRMQYRGVPLDRDLFEKLTQRYEAKVEEAAAKLEEHKPDHPEGEQWVWGNNNKPDALDKHGNRIGRNGALRALAGVGIKLKDLKKPTRIEYLKKHTEGQGLLEALHQYLIYKDLLSDCKSWLEYSYEERQGVGRLYPNVNPFSQVTGRSAYSAPGLQNTPKEADEEGEVSLRDCVRAEKGYKIIKADYAAQELRILAHITEDDALIHAFASESGDPHVVLAERIAGHTLKKGTEDYKVFRKLGKRGNYGFSYGAGAKRYAQSVFEDTAERISEAQAKEEQEAFQATWEKVHEWQKDFGARDGKDPEDWYVTSFVGRRRYVGQKKDRYAGEYLPNYCDRLNGPIQTGGADMLYVALEKLLEDKEAGMYPDVEILITTHDEIVLEAPLESPEDSGASEAKAWLASCMRSAALRFLRPELAGNDCVEGEEGPSWGGG